MPATRSSAGRTPRARWLARALSAAAPMRSRTSGSAASRAPAPTAWSAGTRARGRSPPRSTSTTARPRWRTRAVVDVERGGERPRALVPADHAVGAGARLAADPDVRDRIGAAADSALASHRARGVLPAEDRVAGIERVAHARIGDAGPTGAGLDRADHCARRILPGADRVLVPVAAVARREARIPHREAAVVREALPGDRSCGFLPTCNA